MTTKTFVKDFRKTITTNFCLRDDVARATTTSKNFFKINARNRSIDDVRILFRNEITTIFDFENFDEIKTKNRSIKTIKLLFANDFLINLTCLIDVFLINKRSKTMTTCRIIFSYSLTNFIVLFNFEKFRQTSYSRSQFFQRIKYFDSRFLI